MRIYQTYKTEVMDHYEIQDREKTVQETLIIPLHVQIVKIGFGGR